MGEYVTEGLREKMGEWKSESASEIVSRRMCERERERDRVLGTGKVYVRRSCMTSAEQ